MKREKDNTGGKTPFEMLECYLSANGKRRTPERKAILEAVVACRGVFTVDKVIARLENGTLPGVSRSTVYDALSLFVAAAIVVRLDVDLPQAHYVLSSDEPRCFLVCTSCGKVKAVVDRQLATFIATSRYTAFKPQSFSLMVRGTCSSCSRRAKRPQSPSKQTKPHKQ